MSSPSALVREWVAAFNTGDAGAVADFYSEHAINHQVNQDAVAGKRAIHAMFAHEFAQADMTCLIENLFEDGEWAILEWKDPNGLRGCGFFQVQDDKIVFQRGYWDRLSFLRLHNLPVPSASNR